MAVLAGLRWAPVRLPQVVTTHGRIRPARQWMLVRQAGGSLAHFCMDNRTGLQGDYCVHEIDRGETARLRISSALTTVVPGDTLGWLESSSGRERLVQLQGRRDVALAALAVQESGEKAAVVKIAKSQLDLAREKAVLAQDEHNRVAELFQRNLVPQAQYDAAQSALRQSQIDTALAAARLTAAQTGEKAEEIRLLASEASALQREIDALQSRLAQSAWLAPFGGKLSAFYDSDTLLALSDTRSCVVLCPIRCGEAGRLHPGQAVEVRWAEASRSCRGRLLALRGEVQRLANDWVMAAVVEVEPPEPSPPLGMLARCRIQTDAVTPWTWLSRQLQ